MALKIAFTSCMDAERCADQPVWAVVENEKPDVLILLGDQIYMDWGLSLANVPALKTELQRDKANAMAHFSNEMYSRYRAQWNVTSFRKFIASLPQEMGEARQIFMVWDDHDFAWNDAYGSGDDDRTVPDELKSISAGLALQFRDVLRTGSFDDPYPSPPTQFSNAVQSPFGRQELQNEVAHIVVFDQRWDRTQRDGDPTHISRLLAEDDRTLLYAAAAAKEGGLLIVAGSSPMKHGYMLGHQGWWARPGPGKSGHDGPRAYPEYFKFIERAAESKRPILYLGGDIHRNAYGGPVESGSSIVQVLSSGAALGRMLFRRFPGSFGTVTVTGDGNAASVGIKLFALGGKSASPRTWVLNVKDNKWETSPLEGECRDASLSSDKYGELESHLDQGELPVLCYRERGTALRKQSEFTLKVAELDEHAFVDELPVNDPGSPGLSCWRDWPEPVVVSDVGNEVHISRYRGGDDQRDRVVKIMEDAFLRARESLTTDKKRSVVLFIHGFNKTFSASVNQACELRERFDCEPLLYSWPTGGDGGFFALLGGFGKSMATASAGRKGLIAALGQFCLFAQAYGYVKAVVVARSMGVEALKQAVGTGGLNRGMIDGIDRFLLSCPATALAGHDKWLGQLGSNTVVTINQNDDKLLWANRMKLGASLLGNSDVSFVPRASSTLYLDCTNVPGVDASHDYLIRRVNNDLFELNKALMRGDDNAAIAKLVGPASTLQKQGLVVYP